MTKRSMRGRARDLGLPETLEMRALMSNGADLAVLSATTTDSRSVEAEFRLQDAPGPVHMQFQVYRSSVPEFSSGHVELIGKASVTAHARSSSQEFSIPTGKGLAIDPSRPYVLVIGHVIGQRKDADPAANMAEFRIYTVAAVTDGDDREGVLPGDGNASTWVQQVAQTLLNQGYDAAIPFDWTQYSYLSTPGAADFAARQVAAYVRVTAADDLPGIGANDVVDAHLIGFDRGAGVMATASQLIDELPGTPRSLLDGWMDVTLLDPVTAGPSGQIGAVSSGPLGHLIAGNIADRNASIDDSPVQVSSRAQQVDVVVQHPSSRRGRAADQWFEALHQDSGDARVSSGIA